MFYSLTDRHDPRSHSDPRDVTDAMVPSILVLVGPRQCLYIWKDEASHLELAPHGQSWLISEQFSGRRYHLRGSANESEVVALIRRYRTQSLADAASWYPSLIEWTGLRFAHPRIFSLLNERYSVANFWAMASILGVGILIFCLSFVVGIVFHLSGKLLFLPFLTYGWILAKRVDFRGPRRRYDYQA
jgi:hypothetical protein